jgi:hypothetical protein
MRSPQRRIYFGRIVGSLVFAWGANASAVPLFPAGGRNRLAYSVYRPSGFVFRGGRRRGQPYGPKTHQRRSWSHGGASGYAVLAYGACRF